MGQEQPLLRWDRVPKVPLLTWDQPWCLSCGHMHCCKSRDMNLKSSWSRVMVHLGGSHRTSHAWCYSEGSSALTPLPPSHTVCEYTENSVYKSSVASCDTLWHLWSLTPSAICRDEHQNLWKPTDSTHWLPQPPDHVHGTGSLIAELSPQVCHHVPRRCGARRWLPPPQQPASQCQWQAWKCDIQSPGPLLYPADRTLQGFLPVVNCVRFYLQDRFKSKTQKKEKLEPPKTSKQTNSKTNSILMNEKLFSLQKLSQPFG